MAGTFDECLYVFGPSTLYEFTHGVEFGKLRRVVGIVGRTGTESVTKGDGYIVLGTDVADVIEVLVGNSLSGVPYTIWR